MVAKRAKVSMVVGIMLALASAGIYFTFISGSNLQERNLEERAFLESYYSLVNSTALTTENYHKEIERWERGELDDQELVSITNSYLEEYDQLVDRASGFSTPENFQDALDLYIKSLQSERESYVYFRDFIESGDPILNETSVDLLSNATEYELDSFAIMNSQR
jgi:hypothetical protein